jgi:Mrp family chromosome partitioning ATPase
MKLRRKKKKNAMSLKDIAIALETSDGHPITYFSTDVIDNLRRMVTKIHYKDGLPKVISLTSAIRQEGVTYLSWALGTTIAIDLQKTVCVVELNWWNPTDHLQFAQDAGLAAVLNREIALDKAIIPTNNDNLSLLAAGHQPRRVQRAMWARSDLLQETLQQISEKFDHILLDIPAVRTTSDAIPLASLGDACALVVRQGITEVADVRLALDDITHLPMLGVIMNFVAFDTPSFIMKLIPQT